MEEFVWGFKIQVFESGQRWSSLSCESAVIPIVGRAANEFVLLQNCKTSPVALNPATGQYFDYCSRTCANKARGSGGIQNGNLAPALCEVILGRHFHPVII